MLSHLYKTPIKNVYEVAAVLSSLLREDMIYTNDVISHFSSQPFEGYRTYSEIFRSKYGNDYQLNKD